MNVRFPLSGFTHHLIIIIIIIICSSSSSSSSHPDPIGAASFVVLDTDYSSYALICTCQEIDLFITTVRCWQSIHYLFIALWHRHKTCQWVDSETGFLYGHICFVMWNLVLLGGIGNFPKTHLTTLFFYLGLDKKIGVFCCKNLWQQGLPETLITITIILGPPEVLLYLAEGCWGGRSGEQHIARGWGGLLSFDLIFDTSSSRCYDQNPADHRQADRAAGLPSSRQQPRLRPDQAGGGSCLRSWQMLLEIDYRWQ